MERANLNNLRVLITLWFIRLQLGVGWSVVQALPRCPCSISGPGTPRGALAASWSLRTGAARGVFQSRAVHFPFWRAESTRGSVRWTRLAGARLCCFEQRCHGNWSDSFCCEKPSKHTL